MLWLTWTVSLVLSAISLLVMLFLLGRRAFAKHRERRDAEVRHRLLKALIAFSENNDAEALKSVLRTAPPRIAVDGGFEFLGLLRGDEHARIVQVFVEAGLSDHIRSRLNSRNEATQIHAAEMLAAFPSEEATASLLATLKRDRSREVRIAAAISLSDFGSLPPLDEALAMIGIRGQRSRRLVELFRRFPTGRYGELMKYAKSGNSHFVRAAAIEALSQTGDYQLVDFFRNLAADLSVEVSAASIRALGRLGHPDAEAIVTEALVSKDWEVRLDAVQAAGRIGTPAFMEPLGRLLDDEVWTIRYAAAKAIQRILPGGEEMLRHMASSETSRRQRTASLVLLERLPQ